MEYSIQALAKMAGISTRTLRHYDAIGLLKPLRVNEAGYRYYGAEQVELLQQILFYRQRGFNLKTIQKLLYDPSFDKLQAMQAHLLALQRQQKETQMLIRTVEKTIAHLKGERLMQDKDRFQGLKKQLLEKNEAACGAEARQKYGNEQVDASNQAMLGMSQEAFSQWQALETQILQQLETAVKAGIRPEDPQAGEIVKLHKQWLCMTLPNYTPPIHRGIAAMYTLDERFTAYYDRNIPGCAQLLSQAVQHWI